MILETICVGPMQANCYILASAWHRQAIVIDPGGNLRKIKQALDKYSLSAAFIINTHGHYDHIGCDDKFGVPVYIHSQDLELLKNSEFNLSKQFGLPYQVRAKIEILKDGQTLELEDLQLKVLHIPGHTPGGIALYMLKPTDKIVFTGDSLFAQGIGRTDFSGGNAAVLIESIKEKLLTLPEDTVIYPGHGPSSTIGEEKRNNPYLT